MGREGLRLPDAAPRTTKPRTLVITSHPPAWQTLANITTKTMSDWCGRHGYDLHIDCSDLQDRAWLPCTGEAPRRGIAGFVKMDLFLHFLPMYERVVWLDADMLITNYAVSVNDLAGVGAGVILPYDHNGVNATVIIAENRPVVYDFFWAVNNSGRKMFMNHDWKEMEAMRYFQQSPPYEYLVGYRSVKDLCPILHREYLPYLPERVGERYGWEPGAWSLHLSALPIERRTALAAEYAEKYPCT